ncbi:energy-coupling factor transporter transmembrane protein EcfT [Lactobacillus sp. CC-MHH1034]|uniref:energy-coupling factor transporter transmembrane component T family protein n=1 Tax=Agrilactobacillus fermenti TaxID=2586909 RepID=UPI001E2A89C7|nr:energy-coupling factor transporter transmembrane component T [Agrilactobacillus fermenti]MCD2255354.1 energy-coupling factor transporter transmembrane protein EcfT [Agrilactobacillus fermenti]
MNKMILGRYLPGDTWLHRLDPRTKISISFYFIVIIFFANNVLSYALLLAFTFGVIFSSGINQKFFFNGVRPLFLLILITVFFQLFLTRGGHIYWSFGPFALSQYGIRSSIYVFLRFMMIILMSTLLMLTTAPLMIADAIESLLSPLKRIHFPIDQIALMISLALRFVPTLMDETITIMNAQRARGVDFSDGGLIKRIKAMIPVLIPLFVNTFSRAGDLGTAMESRGYSGEGERTRYRKLTWARRDNIAWAVMLLLTGLLFILRN